MIGRLIDDRYEVRSRIARGGMATVYLATDRRLERRVAIKVMHGHLSDDSNFKNRFVQEARSAARLADPHVVSVFDQGQDSDMAYLVMEYLPGITLRDLLRDHGRLTPHQVIDIMDAVTSGLAAAHRAGIVHRDVKPENILLADDGRIKISDFGLARAASAHTATGQALLGTIAYLSPELVTRGVADARSDIYALGIMMYEMLTGEQPYKGEQPMQIAYQHANESVPRPSSQNSAVPDDFDDLVLWATERNPDERPRDARELLERLREVEKHLGFGRSAAPASTMVMPQPLTVDSSELTQVLTSRSVRTGPVDPEDPSTALSAKSARRRAKGWWALLLVLLLVAAAGGTGWWFGSGPGSQIEVPSLENATQADATAQLEELGFQVAPVEEHSLTVQPGLVIGTNPAAGTRVDKNSDVELQVSVGPRPVTVGVLAGLSLDEASVALDDLGLAVGQVSKQFTDSPADTVLAALQQSDGADLSQGGSSLEGSVVDLVVSAGQVPEVFGLSPGGAEDALQAVGLSVGDRAEEFNDEVQAGTVIGIAPKTNDAGESVAFVPGDIVTLIVSKGPKPIPVPDVVNDNVADAKAELESLGLHVEVTTGLPQPFWGIGGFTVVSTDPVAGTELTPGSTVTIQANY
ncbi:Stk1 family PASTA domain-containing Ser/Thr kinase [Okibacterium endophyticum]